MTRNFFLLSCCCIFYFSIGFVHSYRTKRLVGAKIAAPDEIKYVVAIYQKKYACSGTIIGPKHILTAANCIFDSGKNAIRTDKLYVIAGFNNLSQPETGIKRYVEKAYIPAYIEKKDNLKITNRDIAVLKLKTELNLEDERLEQLELPRKDSINEFKLVKISSFGDFQIHQKSRKTNVLRTTTVFLPDNYVCSEFVKDILPSQTCGKIISNLFARISAGVCLGDGGSPLVIEGKVIAVTSYMTKLCNDKASPTIFTKTAAYLDFIENAKNDIIVDMDVQSFD